MLYVDYINKAIEATITEADNGLFYLEPLWKTILENSNLNVSGISDIKAKWCDVEDVLKLEVEKRNTVNSLKPYVLNWVHDLITASVEPAILQEETEYIKNLTEYMKVKNLKDSKDEDWDRFKET